MTTDPELCYMWTWNILDARQATLLLCCSFQFGFFFFYFLKWRSSVSIKDLSPVIYHLLQNSPKFLSCILYFGFIYKTLFGLNIFNSMLIFTINCFPSNLIWLFHLSSLPQKPPELGSGFLLLFFFTSTKHQVLVIL